MHQALQILGEILSPSLLTFPRELLNVEAQFTLGFIWMMIAVEWLGREGLHALSAMEKIRHRAARWLIYSGLLILMVLFMQTKESPFIYFQF